MVWFLRVVFVAWAADPRCLRHGALWASRQLSKDTTGLLQPWPDSDRLFRRASRPADVLIPHGQSGRAEL